MDPRVTQVMTAIEHRLQDKLSIEALAAEVGLSQSRLGHLFRAATGQTPGAYLHALRMQRARLLIERTSLTVREVMDQVGITDPSHFARDFRNAHGLSPRAFRVQLRMAGAAAPRSLFLVDQAEDTSVPEPDQPIDAVRGRDE